jgi:hypothetical protein
MGIVKMVGTASFFAAIDWWLGTSELWAQGVKKKHKKKCQRNFAYNNREKSVIFQMIGGARNKVEVENWGVVLDLGYSCQWKVTKIEIP